MNICTHICTQITRFMGPTCGPPGSCRPQIGPMLAALTLLSGYLSFIIGICSFVGVCDRYSFPPPAFDTVGSPCYPITWCVPMRPVIQACSQNGQWLATEHLFVQTAIYYDTLIAPHHLLCRLWSLLSQGTSGQPLHKITDCRKFWLYIYNFYHNHTFAWYSKYITDFSTVKSDGLITIRHANHN